MQIQVSGHNNIKPQSEGIYTFLKRQPICSIWYDQLSVIMVTIMINDSLYVETSCVYFCIKNINAEMWAWKNDYDKIIILNEGITL